MKVKIKYKITLIENEAEVLKIILGKLSGIDKVNMRLTHTEIAATSKLFYSLLYIEEEKRLKEITKAQVCCDVCGNSAI